MTPIAEIRPSPIAGTWYSGNPDTLAGQMDAFISQAKLPKNPGKIFGLVAPHAGHRYSGATAGVAYRAVQGKPYELVIILSPSHAYYPAELLTSAHKVYATPLGKIPIHQDALAQLQQELKKTGGEIEQVAGDEEHSIEIQLPFLQRALKGAFSLLPVMMRSQSEETVHQLAQALLPIIKKYESLVIASSDLSHSYPLEIANTMDSEILKMVKNCSPEGVLEAERNGSGSACGAGPIAVALTLAREAGATRVKIVHRSTSAEVTGDTSSVVGYGAAVIYFDKIKQT
jgi:AmmeMemoRadiSam system protein B